MPLVVVGVVVGGGAIAARPLSCAERFSRLVGGQDRWLAYTDDHLFAASSNGASLVAMVQGTQVFGIDQLALRNNRPDLILERFGLGTPELHALRLVARATRGLEGAGPT